MFTPLDFGAALHGPDVNAIPHPQSRESNPVHLDTDGTASISGPPRPKSGEGATYGGRLIFSQRQPC